LSLPVNIKYKIMMIILMAKPNTNTNSNDHDELLLNRDTDIIPMLLSLYCNK